MIVAIGCENKTNKKQKLAQLMFASQPICDIMLGRRDFETNPIRGEREEVNFHQSISKVN